VFLIGCNSPSRNPDSPATPVSSSLDSQKLEVDTITIASWNLLNFGQTKLNDSSRISIIIDVLKSFDIIAIQEVKDVSLELPLILIQKINSNGANYSVVASDRVGRSTAKEQYLYMMMIK
jgi:hypothetical protein